jgi:L-threonylcarbamoyladenylate synthase
VPAIVSAGLGSIAVRMPAHPIAQKLISCVGEPLVAPSANLSGKPSSTHSDHVLEDLKGQIAAVIEGGQTEIGIESTVLSLMGPKPILLRPGAISQEQIEQILECVVEVAVAHTQGPVLSPGMKYRHYAPKTPICIFETLEELQKHAADSPKKRMILSRQPLQEWDHFPLTAHDLYSHLRLSDVQGYQEICILCDSEVRKDSALMNRILRAAGA